MWSKGYTHPLLVGMQTCATTLKISVVVSQEIKLPQDPALPLLEIYPRDALSYYKSICSTMFIAALFVIARTWNYFLPQNRPFCSSSEMLGMWEINNLFHSPSDIVQIQVALLPLVLNYRNLEKFQPTLLKKYTNKGREIDRRLKAHSALAEDLSSVPRTPIKKFTTSNSSSRGSTALFWLLQALHSHVKTDTRPSNL